MGGMPMSEAASKIRSVAWSACFLACALYIPFVVTFLSLRPPRDWTTLPFMPGWLIWFVIDPGRDHAYGLLLAGGVTAFLYLGLLALASVNAGLRVVAILIALVVSVPSALLLRILAGMSA
jgi:hypothetical protein